MSGVYAAYGKQFLVTPQSQAIPGREAEMVSNNAGGFGFLLDDWERLHRFLVIGSEGGTYYVGAPTLTAENAGCAIRCLKADGVRAIAMAATVNLENRAPKTDQQLFVLALAMQHGDDATKALVREVAPKMLRTGTHLLHFVAMLDGLGGWNRSKRRLVAEWFTERGADDLAFQVVKYGSRDGWKQRDVLRVAHPPAPSEGHRAIYDWLCGRENESAPALLRAYAAAHQDGLPAVQKALTGIGAGLPREALPTEALNDPTVWRAMLPAMPLHALLRNLGNMTANGVLAVGVSELATVHAKLTDPEALRRARVHPFAILLASVVYQTGHGARGGKAWTPVPAVVAALEDAYDLAFATVAPTGKRLLIGIDVSRSMSVSCMGTPIPASLAAAAMAITLARLEPNALVVKFDTAVRSVLPVTKRTGIGNVGTFEGGGTDLAAPLHWAAGIKAEARASRIWGFYHPFADQQNQLPPQRANYDAVILLTDNETWAGNQHCSQALDYYRRTVNQKAKLVCCSMAANHANIVDPQDPLSFGCAGLDANLPTLIADFIGK